jgi:hypothetical protein
VITLPRAANFRKSGHAHFYAQPDLSDPRSAQQADITEPRRCVGNHAPATKMKKPPPNGDGYFYFSTKAARSILVA